MLTEPSTPLNDADHAGSSNYLEDTHFMGDELKKHQPALTIDEHLLKKDSHWDEYVQDIRKLFDKYDCVDIKTMGFPEKWEEFLAQQSSSAQD